MRNTNCKETRRAVEAYVMDEVRGVLDRCDVRKPMRPVDAAFHIMRDEMKYQTDTRGGRSIIGVGIARKYREAGRTVNAAVANDPYNVWTLAACAGCFEVYYDGARDRVREWLDETPEEAAHYSNEKVFDLYIHMGAKAFERLHDKDVNPRKVDTSWFIDEYERLNGGHFFDRETLKFFGQTRKSFDITENHIIKDADGNSRKVYRVFSRGNIDGYRFSHVHYFDHETFEEVFKLENSKEA